MKHCERIAVLHARALARTVAERDALEVRVAALQKVAGDALAWQVATEVERLELVHALRYLLEQARRSDLPATNNAMRNAQSVLNRVSL